MPTTTTVADAIRTVAAKALKKFDKQRRLYNRGQEPPVQWDDLAKTLLMIAEEIESSDAATVAPDFACPACECNVADELVWLDDERVQCQRCEHVFNPFA